MLRKVHKALCIFFFLASIVFLTVRKLCRIIIMPCIHSFKMLLPMLHGNSKVREEVKKESQIPRMEKSKSYHCREDSHGLYHIGSPSRSRSFAIGETNTLFVSHLLSTRRWA